MAGQIWISPTLLNMDSDCPRCLVDTVLHKHKRPKGIFPSLPNGVDSMMKTYIDRYRGKLPPVVAQWVKGTGLEGFVFHPDLRWISKLREWNGGVTVQLKLNGINFRLSCSFDDLLMDESDSTLAVIDFKSKAKPPEAGEGAKYYQNQMNAYALALKVAGFRVSPDCLLHYVTPTSFDGEQELGASLRMDQFPQFLTLNPDDAYAQIEALSLLLVKYPHADKPAPSSMRCDFCIFAGRDTYE